MNCDKCQELLSDFIDNELEEKVSLEMEVHLDECFECSELHRDFSGILIMCEKKEVAEETVSPNPDAMWCRINNIIEAEIKPEIIKEREKVNKGWFSGRRIWSFSFGQVAASIVGIAVISSVLTFVGLKNTSVPEEIVSNSAPPSLFQRALTKIGLADSPQKAREKRLLEQQIAIDYWNKRVEARRVQWDKNLQEAFDRNVREINQIVAEYELILEDNPHDELSSEMLDSALNDKVELLREFSDL